jgi:hypothetical protein
MVNVSVRSDNQRSDCRMLHSNPIHVARRLSRHGTVCMPRIKPYRARRLFLSPHTYISLQQNVNGAG